MKLQLGLNSALYLISYSQLIVQTDTLNQRGSL